MVATARIAAAAQIIPWHLPDVANVHPPIIVRWTHTSLPPPSGISIGSSVLQDSSVCPTDTSVAIGRICAPHTGD